MREKRDVLVMQENECCRDTESESGVHGGIKFHGESKKGYTKIEGLCNLCKV